MPRYIDADALKADLDAWTRIIQNPAHYAREDALHIIDSTPTVDVVPVVRGEWIRMDETQALLSVEWKCSLCEQEIRVDGILTAIGAGWNFCPNCGADMRRSEVKE